MIIIALLDQFQDEVIRKWKAIEVGLSQAFPTSIKVFFTAVRGNATEIVLNEINSWAATNNSSSSHHHHPLVILSVGGDDMLGECINGIMQSDHNDNKKLFLYPVPFGCKSNDYWWSLYGKSPKTFGLPILVNSLRSLEPVPVDVGEFQTNTTGLSSTSATCKGYFLNVASVGLTGKVAKRLGHRSTAGKFSLGWTILQTAAQRTSYLVRIRVGERDLGTFDALLVAVCKGKFFSNKLCIAPQAQLNDGKLKVVILRNVSFWQLATDNIVRKLRSGTIESDAEHTVVVDVGNSGENVHIEPVSACHPVLVAVDGEELVGELPCTFGLVRGKKVQMLAHKLNVAGA